MPENALQGGAVILKAPDRHGDIPPAAAPVPDQCNGFGGGKFALGGQALRRIKLHRFAFLLEPGRGIAEHVVGKKAQGRRFAGGRGKMFLHTFYAQFPGIR